MAQRSTAVQPRARILYVDDEPQLRTFGQQVLVQSGYDVDTAADGAEAWAALNESSYNLLVTDHDMPGCTGLELVTQARRAGMRLPIVITSGSLNLMRELARSGSELAAFLPKPFAADMLLETVEQALCAVNNLCRSSGAMVSALARIVHSAQPYPHGGINE